MGFGDPRVAGASAAATLLLAQHVVGKALRESLFLAAFGVERLPLAMIGGAIGSGVLVVGLSRAAGRGSPRRLVFYSLWASGALYGLAWLIGFAFPRAAAVLTYLQASAVSAAAISVFWILVSEWFDPYSARVAVPRIMSGAALGGVLGGIVAWQASLVLEPRHLALIAAALNVAAALAVRSAPRTPRRELAQRTGGLGWRELRSDAPFLGAIGVLVLLGAAGQALADYLLSAAAVASMGTGPALLSFFALFQTAVGVVCFALQAGVSKPLLEKLGVGAGIAVPAAGVVLGAGAWVVLPSLAGAALLRAADGTLGGSLQRSAHEVLFAPIEPRKKRAAKPVLDVGCDRLGTLLGSTLIAGLLAWRGAEAAAAVAISIVVLAIGRGLLAIPLQAGYRRQLEHNLRQGRLGLGVQGVLDARTIGALARTAPVDRGSLLREVERFQAARGASSAARLSIGAFDLAAPDPVPVEEEAGEAARAAARPESSSNNDLGEPRPEVDEVVRALAALRGEVAEVKLAVLQARRSEPVLAPQVLLLLEDDHLAREAADWLIAQDPPPVGLLSDALLGPGLPGSARRRVARILGKVDDPRAAECLVRALSEVPSEVRPGVAHALARIGVRQDLPEGPLLAAAAVAARETGRDRRAVLDEVFSLLAAAFPREPVQAAFRALDRDEGLRGTALEWLDVALPREVKEAVWPLFVRRDEQIAKTRDATELRRVLLLQSEGGASGGEPSE